MTTFLQRLPPKILAESKTKFERKKTKKCAIISVSDEVIVHILSFLRAVDLAMLSKVDKRIFSKPHIEQAVRLIMTTSPSLQLASPLKKQQTFAINRCIPPHLYVLEITNILAALSFPLPLTGEKGEWGYFMG
jgi:hypothetical protein